MAFLRAVFDVVVVAGQIFGERAEMAHRLIPPGKRASARGCHRGELYQNERRFHRAPRRCQIWTGASSSLVDESGFSSTDSSFFPGLSSWPCFKTPAHPVGC